MPGDLKNIIDRDLNATPTKVHENWFNDSNHLMNDYYWELPKLDVHLESNFGNYRSAIVDGDSTKISTSITYKLWVTKK
jgi:hypothetical protein